MKRSQSNAEEVPITAADMARFHKNAWAAIRRREGSYAFDEFAAGLRSVFLGGVPIVGLWRFGWSAAQLLVFFLVGSWVGILCDSAKLRHLENKIRDWANASYDNWHVWTIVHALRNDKTEAPKSHLGARYEPWSGVFIDFVIGGLTTVLICLGMRASRFWAEAAEPTVLLGLIATVAYQIAFTAWEIWEHKSEKTADRQVKVAVGLRGAGLFMFMFLLVAVTDGFEQFGSGLKTAMLAVNGAIILWGLVTMVGPWFIRNETAWLREYMKQRGIEKKK